MQKRKKKKGKGTELNAMYAERKWTHTQRDLWKDHEDNRCYPSFSSFPMKMGGKSA